MRCGRGVVALAGGLVLGLWLCACSPTPKGTPVANSTLKLAVKAGDVHRLRLIREELLIQGNPAAKERLSRHLGVDVSFRVLQVEADGTAHMHLILNGGKYKQGGELGDSDELPPIFKKYSSVDNPLANIKGQTMYLMITPDWALINMEGVYDYETKSGVVAAIIREYELDSEETRTDALGDFAAGWREGIGYEVGAQIVSDLMDLFPKGFYDTRGQGYSRDALGIGTVRGPDCVWMVGSPQGSLATLKTRARLQKSGGGGDDEEDRYGPPITYELTGTKKGTLVVDTTKGWIVSGRIDEDYSGKKVVRLGETQRLTYPASFKRVIRYEQPK